MMTHIETVEEVVRDCREHEAAFPEVRKISKGPIKQSWMSYSPLHQPDHAFLTCTDTTKSLTQLDLSLVVENSTDTQNLKLGKRQELNSGSFLDEIEQMSEQNYHASPESELRCCQHVIEDEEVVQTTMIEQEDITSEYPKRKKRYRNYLLPEFLVGVQPIVFSIVQQACRQLQMTSANNDKRSKSELIKVEESLSSVKLSYSVGKTSQLVQGLDVLSPRGFSILKKIACQTNKNMKQAFHHMFTRKVGSKTAKIQLLTQKLALRMCHERLEGQHFISFVKQSTQKFADQFRSTINSLKSCTDTKAMYHLIAYLLDTVLKNGPAVKAFLNHLHTLMVRIKEAGQSMNAIEQVEAAFQMIHEACGIYHDCFKEDPLAFNQSYWNQCDSFSGGGLVLYIEGQLLSLQDVHSGYKEELLEPDHLHPDMMSTESHFFPKGPYSGSDMSTSLLLEEEL